MLFSGTVKWARDERTAVSCDVCSALVPRRSVQVHRRWHDEQDALRFRETGGAPEEASLEELLAVIEQVKAVPEIRPRTEFVTDLRERLLAETLDAMIDEQDLHPRHGECQGRGLPRRQQWSRQWGHF